MKDLYPSQINLSTSYVSKHKEELRLFFGEFDTQISKKYSKIEKKLNSRLKFKFNRYGGLIIHLSKINKEELSQLQIIENSYFGVHFLRRTKAP